MIDYAKYLAPIPNSGFNCNGCGNPIEKRVAFSAHVRIAARFTVKYVRGMAPLKIMPAKKNNT